MSVPKPKKLYQDGELELPVNSTTSNHQWTKSTRSPTLAFFTLRKHFRCSTWDMNLLNNRGMEAMAERLGEGWRPADCNRAARPDKGLQLLPPAWLPRLGVRHHLPP